MPPIKFKKPKTPIAPFFSRKKRDVGGLVLEEFLEALKEFSGATEKTAEELSQLSKSVSTGSEAVDQIIHGLKFEKTSMGFLRIGEDVPVNVLSNVIKQADLAELVRISKSEIVITESDSKMFADLVGKTPERAIYNLEKQIELNRTLHPDLDVKVSEMESLPKETQLKIKYAENSLISKLGTGVAIATVFGTVYVTSDWIRKETRKREGCFMIKTIDGKIASCKLANRSCDAEPGYECQTPVKNYNATLVAMTVAAYTNNNDTIKKVFAEKLDVPIEDLNNQLPILLKEKFPVIESLAKKYGEQIAVDPCKIKHDGIDDGLIPFCRACSPSADPNSTSYIDTSLFGKNVTFKCVKNPSILNVISDVMQETGLDLLSGFHTIGNVLKFSIIATILVFFIIIITYIWKLFANRTPSTSTLYEQPYTNRFTN